jgi:septal ring factor EnvC (AmiA/AmiB activator)
LIVRDKNGEIYSVRYAAVNAMLLNEFLKEHKKVEEQRMTIAELKSTVAQQKKEFQAAIAEQRKELEARLKQQDSKLQRVSDRIELGRSVPQMAGNDP